MRKSINIEEITLSYIEKNENSNQTIFFIHGNSSSSRMWQKQFESELFDKYRLIAIDLPGHGASSHSNYPSEDYSPIGTAKILSGAIKKLSKGNPYLFVGSSYGSNLAVELIMHDLDPVGVVLLGSSVFGEGYGLNKIFVQTESPSIFLFNESDKTNVSDFWHKSILTNSDEDIQNSIEDYLAVSTAFKPSLFKSTAANKISDEIRILQGRNIRVCVIFGKKDNLVNIDYLDALPFPVWRNVIFKLPEAGHWANIDQPEAFNRIVFEYVEEAFIQAHV